jgi:arsenate reductase
MANTARSQMAEAFLRSYAGDRFDAYSAGFEPRKIDPMTIEVMSERGFDLAGQRSKGFDEFLGKVHFGFLIILCDRAQRACPTTFPGMGTRLFWPFDDPVAFEGTEEERRAKFREVRDAIDARIQEWLRSR